MNSTAPTPTDQLHALLAVIADPAAHKARLDELVAQENATKARIAELNDMASETRRQNSAAKAANIVSDNRKTALDAREAEIGERAKNLDLAIAAQKKSDQATAEKLRQRETTVSLRESTLERREARIKDMEAETKAAFDQAESLKTKLQRQAAAVNVALAQ